MTENVIRIFVILVFMYMYNINVFIMYGYRYNVLIRFTVIINELFSFEDINLEKDLLTPRNNRTIVIHHLGLGLLRKWNYV